MSSKKTTHSDAELLYKKIEGIRIAMMTTVEPDGSLHSRPMVTQDTKDVKFDGNLWFFTQASAPKVGEVQQHRSVNLSYAKPDDNLFVSVSGTAELVRDAQKVKELWRPFYKAWFPDGPDNAELALLKVKVENAEYWDAPSGKMGLLSVVTKNLTSHSADAGGSDVKLDIR